MKKTSPTIKRISLQAPFDLVQWLEKQAKAERRSLSKQVICYLEKAREDAKIK